MSAAPKFLALPPSETSSERPLAPKAANDNVPRGCNDRLHLVADNTEGTRPNLSRIPAFLRLTDGGDLTGNGQVFSQTLNARLLPEHTRSAKGSNIALDMTYAYDPRGKVTNIINAAIVDDDRTYTYDALGRLLTADGAWGSGSYLYDALGNLRTKTVGGIELVMSYDSQNRLTSHTYADVGDSGGTGGGNNDPDPDDDTNGDNDDSSGNGDECEGGILIGLVCYPNIGFPPPPGGGLPPPPDGNDPIFVSVPFSAGSSASAPRILSYDARGNVTALGDLNFAYDMSDQPTAISGSGPGGVVSGSYTYDGNLKRVRSIIGGKTIIYHGKKKCRNSWFNHPRSPSYLRLTFHHERRSTTNPDPRSWS